MHVILLSKLMSTDLVVNPRRPDNQYWYTVLVGLLVTLQGSVLCAVFLLATNVYNQFQDAALIICTGQKWKETKHQCTLYYNISAGLCMIN